MIIEEKKVQKPWRCNVEEERNKRAENGQQHGKQKEMSHRLQREQMSNQDQGNGNENLLSVIDATKQLEGSGK